MSKNRHTGETQLVGEGLTGEPADSIAERAISQHRLRLEGGPGSPVPAADPAGAAAPGAAPG